LQISCVGVVGGMFPYLLLPIPISHFVVYEAHSTSWLH
jgi:hypothetical protein